MRGCWIFVLMAVFVVSFVSYSTVAPAQGSPERTVWYAYWVGTNPVAVAWVTGRDYQAEGGYALVWSHIVITTSHRVMRVQELYACAQMSVAPAAIWEKDLSTGQIIQDRKFSNPIQNLRQVFSPMREWHLYNIVCRFLSGKAISWAEAEYDFARLDRGIKERFPEIERLTPGAFVIPIPSFVESLYRVREATRGGRNL